MRTPADLPRRRAQPPSRVWLVATVATLLFLLTSLRGVASFYTTYLWFQELRLTSIWKGMLGTRIGLGAVFTAAFFVLLWVNLFIADRLAPKDRIFGPEDELVQRYRETVGPHTGRVRLLVSALFALLAGSGTAAHWQEWLLFRNSVPFGIKDPQFGREVSFFVFELPFLSFLVNWAFVAVVITAVVTVVAHYLNGGIRMQGAPPRVSAHVKAHVSVLLGGLALVKAVGYYLQRYELAFSTRGVVEGATYTDVKAQLPAIQLLILISLAAFVLFLANIRRQGWVLPIIGVGLWAFISIVVGAIYPAFIQKFRVDPSEVQREAPYIARNIKATRQALGIDDVKETDFAYNETLTAKDLDSDAATIRNVRLWDPQYVGRTYQRLQEFRQYYRFNDVDVDRYEVDGQVLQTIVSARELNPEDLPSQSWVNRHLQFTHGYGAVISPANAVTGGGQPDFLVKGVPPTGLPEIKQPRLYYGDRLPGYAIVNTEQKEIDFQTPDGRTEESQYAGAGGVPMGSTVRRAAFALRFGDINPLISGLISSKSKAIFIRDINERVRQAAPFLKYDADPYPVVDETGRIVWIQDAYTTTSRYPYGQQADLGNLPAGSGLRTTFNYVRNSVKVVTDAYDGTMTFYLWDPGDPIATAYSKAFPKLFTSKDQMSPALQRHLRYPEDLFRVQTNMYGRYHIQDPEEFYRGTDRWNVSQDPGSGNPAGNATPVTALDPRTGRPIPATSARIEPTYLLLRLPGDEKESFVLLRPFVASSTGDKQQNLTALMTASSDPGSYGQLRVLEMPRGEQIDGPAIVNSKASQNQEISSAISLLNREGSEVKLGNVLTLPVQNSILYVRPLYVQATANPLPELKKVIAVFGGRAVMGDTLKEALVKLFGAAPETLEAPKPGDMPGSSPGTGSPPSATDRTVGELLDQAQQAFDAAQTALKAGDLATYQKEINRAGQLVAQAREKASGTTTTTSTTTATTA